MQQADAGGISKDIAQAHESQAHLMLAHEGEGPCAVYVVGMHGNEKAAVQAAEKWIAQVELGQVNGSIYILKGNLKALAMNQRYVDTDFNRIWSPEHLHAAMVSRKPKAPNPPHEYEELLALHAVLDEIIIKHKEDGLFFFDLHTTSSPSIPFLPFNDSLSNRALAEQFNIPLVLGIEEYLDDTFMSYINDLNFPALAFEAGQHEDPHSMERHICFIQLSLQALGIIHLDEEEYVQCHIRIAAEVRDEQAGFFDIRFRHHVIPEAQFEMIPGFKSFQSVAKAELLAKDINGSILSPYNGLIFMPLYQSQGQDGFFIIKKLSRFWLILSRKLRLWGVNRIVPYLPGIRPHPTRSQAYTIKGFTLGLMGKKFLHLLGYRVKIRPNQPVLLARRD